MQRRNRPLKAGREFQYRQFRFAISHSQISDFMCCYFRLSRVRRRSAAVSDEYLHNSLGSPPSDDDGRELMGDPAKPNSKDRAKTEMQKRLQQELGSAAQKEGKPKDPIQQAARRCESCNRGSIIVILTRSRNKCSGRSWTT